jgi:predicted amidophosphoribosyltransferase
MLCERCRSLLALTDPGTACRRCGAPDGRDGCAECGRTASFAFDSARCAGLFEPPLSRLVVAHKDSGELRLTAVLACLAADAAGEWTQWADAVVPVPASPAALRRRGFDHGALLAAAFSVATGVAAVDALQAARRRDQRGLAREERQANMRAALAVVAGVAVPPRVLLLDDVFTTGATLDAAAVALKAAGAREVRAVAVARTVGGRL